MHKLTKHGCAGLILGALSLSCTTTAPAETTAPTQARQAMAENHKKMAEMHAKMAACLASDKTTEACREEMTTSCSTNFGANCPMAGQMHQGGRGRGMMGGGPCMSWLLDPGAPAPKAAPSPSPKK